MNELKGKSAVVIGGGSGIGRGIALGFAEAGLRVTVADIDLVTAESVVAEIVSAGGTAIAVPVDGTDRASLAGLASRASEAHDGVQVLSSNIGVVFDRSLDTATEEDWSWIIEFNLLSHVRAVDVFLPHLRASGEPGHIVLTSSLAGVFVVAGSGLPVHLGLYTATKHAVLGYGLTLRAELEPEDIGVSVLCPGIVQSNLAATSARHRPERHGGPIAGVPDHIPVPGAMPAEDVGPVVVKGILANRPHILTHPQALPMVERRNAVLAEDFRFFSQ